MCKAFLSSLGNLGLLWFNKLRAGSIRSYAKLKRAFNTRFIMSKKQAKEPDALDRYWQMFNEIPGVDQYWVAHLFKNGLESVN
ncbi:hypothetical protein RHMOL_Rhmol04G0223300 [Rhododendron molle]|uniref:Uncharacterized protein n=1 Tax=Rhododendron molle TaxID=49168 RepID=A0ACC0P4D2_RHOML|nr:hypothetical protein RHMOL_Rhmol04G0223300 [Rhododendron molle]